MNFFLGGRGAGPGSQCGVAACTLAFATLRSQDSVRIMSKDFLCLTKPAFMHRPWRITPCPAVHGWAFLCFVGIISTVSRQLRYSPSRACVCLPPGFLTLWLYLPSCRFAHGYCRGLALCVFVICVCFARSPPGSLGFARSLRGFAQG